MMHELSSELVETLDTIRSGGGTVTPTFAPGSERGYEYAVQGEVLRERDLERLAQFDYLDKVFADRLSHCPSCGSHAINMREICTVCKSANIGAVELLHHFRCGYVAPAYEFTPEPDGRRCPKCHGLLVDRGTDHEVPGPHFVCQSCYVSFQMPEMGGLCLNCGTHTNGNDLAKIVYEDAYIYKLSPVGGAALRAGVGGMLDEVREEALPVMRRSMFMAFLEDEYKRHKRFQTPFSLLLVTVNPPEGQSASTEADLVEALQELLTETDKIGRYDDRHYLILMPGTDDRKAAVFAGSLADKRIRAFVDWDVKAMVLRTPFNGMTMGGIISSAVSPVHA